MMIFYIVVGDYALVDKFYGGPINYYINTHEQSAGHAATGYAKSTDKTGVAIVT